MAVSETRIVGVVGEGAGSDRYVDRYVEWRPVFAGALTAAAITLVLLAFQAAVGLATASPAPTWRDASIALWLLSGLFAILVSLLSFGAGGYIAGRMRSPLRAVGNNDEVDFRDGVHGLLVWSLALVIGALVALAAAQSISRLAAPAAGSAGPATSVAGENTIAYELDRLFRAERRPSDVDMTYARAEAARILLTASGHSGMTPDDRAYLVRLVSSRTGLAAADAEQRVTQVIQRSREQIRRARATGVMVGFMTAAALLIGAVVAWFAACAGGRHRDSGTVPALANWNWKFT